MPDMPRPRKPYLQREVTRHGKTVWYFRRGKEKRIRLPGLYGSPEFNEAYDAAYAGKPIDKKARAPKSSLRWLVDQYYQSGRFEKLKPNTQRNQRLALEKVCKTGGNLNFRAIDAAAIRYGIVRREKTPHQALAYVGAMRAVFEFAIDNNWITSNPTAGIKAKQPKSDGYHTWTLEEVSMYQKSPSSTKIFVPHTARTSTP